MEGNDEGGDVTEAMEPPWDYYGPTGPDEHQIGGIAPGMITLTGGARDPHHIESSRSDSSALKGRERQRPGHNARTRHSGRSVAAHAFLSSRWKGPSIAPLLPTRSASNTCALPAVA